MRFFPRGVLSKSHMTEIMAQPPNPFASDPKSSIERIKMFSDERLEELESFVQNTQKFEVFLKDECANPKFDLSDHLHQTPIKGSFQGDNESIRKEKIHEDSFTKLFDGRRISKMAIGTQSLNNDIQSDMFHYMALKYALTSGGINHIDTGF